jgi:hypothetical protein
MHFIKERRSMNRKFRTTALGAAAAFAMLMSVLLTTSQPAQAQVPTPRQCGLVLTTPAAWDTSTWLVRSFSCVTVQVETRAYLHWPCVPGPHCTPWPVFQMRARRTSWPSIVLARAQANPGPTCVAQPTSTAWTSWQTCSRGPSFSIPPSELSLIGVYF